MVSAGFIVEGTSDYIILKSDRFQNLLKYTFNINSGESLIRIAHSRSSLKKNIKSWITSLIKEGVNHIFILVDQDNKEDQRKNRKFDPDDCPVVVVNEIVKFHDNKHYLIEGRDVFIVMVREMEAWFLADDNLDYKYEGLPEEILNPSELIQSIERTTNHVLIANRVANKFSLERAAEKSPSAKRFLRKLSEISPLK